MINRPVLLCLLSIAASCGAPPPVVTDAGATFSFSHRIDPSVKPATRLGDKPLSAAKSASGAVHVFISNELLVATPDRAVAEALAARLGATIIGDDAVPEAPAELNLTIDPAYRTATQYTLHLDPSRYPLTALDEDASSVGLSGETVFSDELGARLLALVTHEKRGGLSTSPNFVFEGALLDSSREHLIDGVAFDPFSSAAYLATGSKTNVVDLWRFVAAAPPSRTSWVAVIDSGFWLDATGRPMSSLATWASDFSEHPVQYDFQRDDRIADGPNDGSCTGGSRCNWHGNGAAAVAAGAFDNGYGGAGTGGQVAQPMLFRADFDWSHVARALRTASAWRADVISMSFGANCDNAFCDGFFEFNLYPALRDARDHGLVMVAAAGNVPTDSANGIVPCKANEAVICVGALADGTITAIDYSSSGSSVDLWAPTNIVAHPDGDTTPGVKIFGGTSASTPFVAGVAAVLRAYDPTLDSAHMNDVLRRTAWRDSADPKVSHALNAFAALRAVASGVNAPPDGVITVRGGLVQEVGTSVSISVTPRDLEDGSPCCSVTWTPAPFGTSSEGRFATFRFDVTGTARVTATIRDHNGGEGTVSVDLELHNSAPVPEILQPSAAASLALGQQLQLRGRAVDVNETSGEVPCAQLVWTSSVASDTDFPRSGCDTMARFSSVGPRVLTLTANDSHGGHGTATRSVTVTAPPVNLPPDVTVGSLPMPGYAGGYVSSEVLTVSASAVDPEGNAPISYRWYATTFTPGGSTVFHARTAITAPSATGALSWRPDDTPSLFATFATHGNACYSGQDVRLEVVVTDSLGNARTVTLPTFKVYVCVVI